LLDECTEEHLAKGFFGGPQGNLLENAHKETLRRARYVVFCCETRASARGGEVLPSVPAAAEFPTSTGVQEVPALRRTYVPLPAIADAVIQALKRWHPSLACYLAVYNDAGTWGRLDGAITALNGRDWADVEGRALLAAWTRGLRLEEVIRVFIKARRRIARQFAISLEKEPPPAWPHIGLRSRKKIILRKVRNFNDLRFAPRFYLVQVLLRAQRSVHRKKASRKSRNTCTCFIQLDRQEFPRSLVCINGLPRPTTSSRFTCFLLTAGDASSIHLYPVIN
jgi:hypothetical protein